MEDKDRIIVAIYLDTRDIDDVYRYITECTYHFKDLFDESVRCIVIPQRETSTHIEVLNPKYIDQNKYSELVDEITKKLKNDAVVL